MRRVRSEELISALGVGRSFMGKGYQGGTPLPPRSIGIIKLARKMKFNLLVATTYGQNPENKRVAIHRSWL
jgi:hypothetical protein